MSNLWSVAVDAPMPTALTYAAPEHLQTLLQRGMQVHVPLGKRKTTGVLLGPSVVEKKTLKLLNSKSKKFLISTISTQLCLNTLFYGSNGWLNIICTPLAEWHH